MNSRINQNPPTNTIPRSNSKKIDQQYQFNNANPDLAEADYEEDWCISSNNVLKKIPHFALVQILEGKANGLDKINIYNKQTRKMCNFVDLANLKYYWLNNDGTLQNNPGSIYIIKKQKPRNKN